MQIADETLEQHSTVEVHASRIVLDSSGTSHIVLFIHQVPPCAGERKLTVY